MRRAFYLLPVILSLLFFPLFVCAARSEAVSFIDHRGTPIRIERTPERVVSLVPAVTEMMAAIGAGDRLTAVTYHDTRLPGMAQKPVVGGFAAPSVARIAALDPEIIFYAGLQTDVSKRFAGSTCQLVNLEPAGIADSFETLRILGRIFDRGSAARAVCDRNREQLELIARKIATIPARARRRVVCLLGSDAVRAPGDDAVQNQMIRAAGGIPPRFGRKGAVIDLTEKEWRAFNPEVVYGCYDNRRAVETLLSRPGWQAVDAVRNRRIYFFSCDLACRAAARTGEFVSRLAARVYAKAFARREHQVLDSAVFRTRRLGLDLPYVLSAQIAYSHIDDFENKTLLVDFDRPMRILSTLEGQRDGILTVGNHYMPPAGWGLGHGAGLAALRAGVYPVVDRPAETTTCLFTGADMDHLSVQRARFREMEIQALVTAGVCANALRASKDQGAYYEPGTINIILLPNMALTPRAMARAIISATEAKTAALLDLDIRSSVSPGRHGATGTGTDNVIVVQGDGRRIDNAGGHTKMGELIATAVYRGVREAIERQNGLQSGRDLFQRLAERHLTVADLAAAAAGPSGLDRARLLAALEGAFCDPQHAAFLSSALAISDAYEAGLIADLAAYRRWCRHTAEAIAGDPMDVMAELITSPEVPTVLRLAVNGVVNGVVQRLRAETHTGK